MGIGAKGKPVIFGLLKDKEDFALKLCIIALKMNLKRLSEIKTCIKFCLNYLEISLQSYFDPYYE